MPKYLLIFEKGESVRWLGHLDILRTFERAIRRAGLPIAFTNGFNPRERIAFASALSTGITGQAEPVVMEFNEDRALDRIMSELNDALPPGLRIHHCEEIPDAGSRDLLNGYDRADYLVTCTLPVDSRPPSMELAIAQFLEQPVIEVSRERDGRTKTSNIRPFIFDLGIASTDGERARADVRGNAPDCGRITLAMRVALGEGTMARPAEITSALGSLLPGLKLRRAHRVRLARSADAGLDAPRSDMAASDECDMATAAGFSSLI